MYEKTTKKYVTVERNQRQMGPACECKLSLKSSKLFCRTFSQEDRLQLFNNFWQLNWDEKKMFVKGLVDTAPIKLRKAEAIEKQRKGTLCFHLKKNSIRLRVCKKMFLETLCVGEWSVASWVNVTQTQNIEQLNTNCKSEPTEKKKFLINFFQKLPKLESHYCRKETSKLYLEPMWQNINELYRCYTNECRSTNEHAPVSHTYFRRQFEDQNLSLFRPKCLAYRPNGLIEYKLYYEDDWKLLPQRPNKEKANNAPPLSYPTAPKITLSKFNDLQDMKNFIPKDFRHFYESLAHECPQITTVLLVVEIMEITDTVERALEAIRNGVLSQRKAAIEFGVPDKYFPKLNDYDAPPNDDKNIVIKYHYCWIKDMSRLLSFQLNSYVKLSKTAKYQRHVPYSAGYYFKCAYDDSLSYFRSYRSENYMEWFAKEMNEISKFANSKIKSIVPMVEKPSPRETTVCHICEKRFSDTSEKKILKQEFYSVDDDAFNLLT
ncbi:unnamed protein product [Diabrotica balteata]|uniref:HTH psq-type domain-containing protein n=1 Tax=Diabrotica balteata TaxID=107213 RepID=A0A9N9XGS4_DIABA|nr:unnamed protein product [Diabrotica balteata]